MVKMKPFITSLLVQPEIQRTITLDNHSQQQLVVVCVDRVDGVEAYPLCGLTNSCRDHSKKQAGQSTWGWQEAVVVVGIDALVAVGVLLVALVLEVVVGPVLVLVMVIVAFVVVAVVVVVGLLTALPLGCLQAKEPVAGEPAPGINRICTYPIDRICSSEVQW